jgi:DNA repair protein RadC
LILKDQNKAAVLLEHFGSLDQLARVSVQELLPFLSRAKAAQLVSSLRLAAVALREEWSKLVIDTPLAVANLCAEMRFLCHESLRVILLDTRQQLIKVVSISEGTLNEALAHPREVFKPVIVFSAFAFIMVHNHPSGDPSPSEADLRLTRSGQKQLLQFQRRRRHFDALVEGVITLRVSGPRTYRGHYTKRQKLYANWFLTFSRATSG